MVVVGAGVAASVGEGVVSGGGVVGRMQGGFSMLTSAINYHLLMCNILRFNFWVITTFIMIVHILRTK